MNLYRGDCIARDLRGTLEGHMANGILANSVTGASLEGTCLQKLSNSQRTELVRLIGVYSCLLREADIV